VTKIVSAVLESNGIPGAVAALVTGNKDVGEALVESRDVELGTNFFCIVFLSRLIDTIPVSFTGSEAVGRAVGRAVQSRFGKSLLELGGNNGRPLRN
jgi:aldehyde dehydrogenase family 7 member A1